MENKPPRKPLVSIVTVNFNQPELTEALLLSLRQLTYEQVEIIVVDNGCQRRCLHLQPRFPQVRFIQSKENLGFAGGNNLGIRQARGEYILMLNNDTEVEPSFLEPMLQLFDTVPCLGIVSPLLLFQETGQVQYAGAKGINYFTGRGKKTGFKQPASLVNLQAGPTGLAHGAAMLFPKKLIHTIGYLPEVYFLYYEEHDWGEACKRAGYKIYFQGASSVFHKESASVGRTNPLKTYYLNRNRLLFIRRNAVGVQKACAVAFFLLIAFPKSLLVHLLKGEKEHINALLKALSWHIWQTTPGLCRFFKGKPFLFPSYESSKNKA